MLSTGGVKGSGGRPRLRERLWSWRKRPTSPSPEECDEFLRENLNSVQVAPPGPVAYNKRQHKYEPQEDVAAEYGNSENLPHNCQEAEQLRDLNHIIAAHDEDSDAKFQSRGASWDLVFNQMAIAIKQHGKKTDCTSKFNSVADVASSYVSLIPEEYGIGILKSGLALIFEAASKHEENRGRILDTFETLPSKIATISMAFDRLNPSPEALDFFANVLNMFIGDIPFLVEILVGKESWYRKATDFLLLKIPETLTIDGILSRWDVHISRLDQHVEGMKITLFGDIPSKLDGIEEKATSAGVKLDGIDEKAASTNAMVRTLVADNIEMKQALESLKRNNVPIPIEPSRRTYMYADILTGFREDMIGRKRDRELRERELQYLERDLQCREREQQYREQDRIESYRERRELRAGRRKLEQENQFLSTQVATLSRQVSNSSIESTDIQSGIHPMQLLGVLGIVKDDFWNDLRWVLRQHEHFDSTDRGKAQWIVNTDEFRNWSREDHSSIILVDGCMNPSLTSPLSGICGGLIGTIAEDEDSAVTFFFAGLHVDRSSGINCGPAAMMKSLIAQLILSADLPAPDLGSMDENTLEDCSRGDIRVLCDVFVAIVKQIPEHMTVFCLVDGVSWYEQPPWSADIYYVATVLEYLANRDTGGRSGLVKVLLTSPSQSMEIVHLARKREDVWWYVSLAAEHVHPHGGRMAPDLLLS